MEILLQFLYELLVLNFDQIRIFCKKPSFVKYDRVFVLFANKALVFLGKLPYEIVILLKVAQRFVTIVGNFLIEYKFGIIDLSRHNKMVNRVVFSSAETLLRSDLVDLFVLVDNFGGLSHDYVVFVELSLLIQIHELPLYERFVVISKMRFQNLLVIYVGLDFVDVSALLVRYCLNSRIMTIYFEEVESSNSENFQEIF